MPVEPAVSEHPTGGDPDRLGHEPAPFTGALDRARARRRRRRLEADVVRDILYTRRMVRIRNKHDAAEMTVLQEPRRRRERLPGRTSARLAQDRVLRDLVIVKIRRAD